jgi:hypothetical protein
MTRGFALVPDSRYLLVPVVLLLAFFLGRTPSLLYVIAPLAVIAALAVMRKPRLGLFAIIIVALVVRFRIGTGTDVDLYPVALLVPALCAVWLLASMVRKQVVMPPSRIHLPLVLFLVSGLVSLAIGTATWDPMVPRKDTFLLVQLAQWAIFAFSAGALWLTASLADSEIWLKRMTILFFVVAGAIALLRISPATKPLVVQFTTGVAERAPFWLLLSALAGGQLLFNRKLPRLQQLALIVLLGATLYFAFSVERKTASFWVAVATGICTLLWLRFPRMRIVVLVLIVVFAMTGTLSQSLWDFGGGTAEWDESGGSRLVLINRVIEVTMRNPITGLGPAAYRPYANMKPLLYGLAYWIAPTINSHNNYVDLFAHVGIVGLILFFWFSAEVAWLGIRLRRRYTEGFAAGYVNSMLAAGASALVVMALADWILPFVYNISFYGFQASVLVWLFLGGLVALENMPHVPQESVG